MGTGSAQHLSAKSSRCDFPPPKPKRDGVPSRILEDQKGDVFRRVSHSGESSGENPPLIAPAAGLSASSDTSRPFPGNSAAYQDNVPSPSQFRPGQYKYSRYLPCALVVTLRLTDLWGPVDSQQATVTPVLSFFKQACIVEKLRFMAFTYHVIFVFA